MEFTQFNKVTVLEEIKQAITVKFNAWQLLLGQCDLCGNDDICQPLLCQYCLADLAKFSYPKIGQNLLYWPAVDKILPKRKFDHLFCLSPYIWPIDHWLKQFKYQNRFELAPLFADLITPLWQENLAPLLQSDYLLTAIPIHPQKWQQRGYNQAHLIAKSLARNTKINYQPDLLLRTINGSAQVGQSGVQRRKSLSGAFSLNPDFSELPEQIVLLDDVLTTGTTVNEVSKLLKKNGVKTVTVLTLALSLPNKIN